MTGKLAWEDQQFGMEAFYLWWETYHILYRMMGKLGGREGGRSLSSLGMEASSESPSLRLIPVLISECLETEGYL